MKLTRSPRLNYLLFNMGIYNQFDVISHLPRRYEDLNLTDTFNLQDKQRIVVYGTIMSTLKTYKKAGFSLITFDFLAHDNNLYKIKCFNRPYYSSTFKVSNNVTIVGVYEASTHSINVVNMYKGEIAENEKLKPIYKLPQGYQNYLFANLVKSSFEQVKDRIYNDIPTPLRNKYHLIDKRKALELVHFPTCKNDIKDGLRHLKYEEALMFALKTQIIKEENKSFAKVKKEPIDIDICDKFINNLPFKLTDDQYQAGKEIIQDMNKSSLMYRLLQGDVGSGKTVVCFLALYANHLRGDQGALMAPTDALARQHYENALKTFKGLKLRIELLVGSTPLAKKKQIQEDLREGLVDIVIGTHALFSKGVEYNSLGLAIIDEQHRFGVNQRLKLASKGDNADLLMMSATPIPRSLALSIYGDLDISTLTSFPSSVKDIKTRVVKSNDDKIFKGIDYILNENRQVYIVVPLIDYSDDNRYSIDSVSAKYLLKYPNRVGVLHGKMKQEEKEEVLRKFYNHEIDILVSTLVIEVGIDVKNASLMVIYDASNFGLASLHQLRGRIGRDGHPSFCFLTYDGDDENELAKLKVLQNSLDGFEIAEQDLKLRGPGELSGLRQSGMPDFKFLNVYNDIKIFTIARDDAKAIMNDKDNQAYAWILKKCRRIVDEENEKLG